MSWFLHELTQESLNQAFFFMKKYILHLTCQQPFVSSRENCFKLEEKNSTSPSSASCFSLEQKSHLGGSAG